MSRRWFSMASFVLALVLVSGPAALAQQDAYAGLDAYISRVQRDWGVPGAAVVVVKNDAVVFKKVYGVRTLGKPAPVDENTLFVIGSATKAFTVASLGILVDEGKLKWDDHVSRLIPGFELYDPYATREVTVRDIVSHRTGLPGENFLFWGSQLPRDEIIRRMRFLRPNSSIRSHFAYQNEMFITAGQIIPAITGKSWDDFVRERIFAPLGMSSSLTSEPASPEGMDLASPHSNMTGTMQPIPEIKLYNAAPAGAIHSNIDDMEKWLRLQMHNGSFNGKRIFSEAAAKEMHTPQTLIPMEAATSGLAAADANFFAYGLGWFLHDYHGHLLIDHGGATDGMTTMVAFSPDDNFGFVILTNSDQVSFLESVMFRIFDIGLERPEKDWNAYYRDLRKKVEDKQKAAEEKFQKDHVAGTKPSLPLAAYAGKYTDDLYGPAEISLNGDKLVLRLTDLGFNADLEHWNYDTFRIQWRITDHLADPSVRLLTFVLDAEGKPSQLRIEHVGEFHRVP